MTFADARRCRALVVACVVAGGCAEPLQFAEWTIPVPEETRVIEYIAVPMQERVDRIDVVEDLAFGGQPEDPDQLFYRPSGLAVDAAGRIHVLDRGNHRVQVFDADGAFVTTWGRQGEGPGEFTDPRWIAAVGERVAVLAGGQRLSVWKVGEGHVADHRLPEANDAAFFAGTAEGNVVLGFHTHPDARRVPDQRRTVVGVFTLEGNETARLGEADDPSSTFEISAEGVADGLNGPRPSMSVAVAPQGQIYLTAAAEYQVLAAHPTGDLVWALRVAGRPEPLSADQKEAWLSPLRDRYEQVVRFDVDWPDRKPALAGLQVDGHGHVYVFPFVLRATPESEVPVDVYDAEGTRLFSGTIVNRRWRAAHGSFVYDLERDPETAEMKMVRYRLLEPFS
jgi:hypothetical protein